MESKFKITIPKPCHEDWNAMTPEETGRFCSVCTKGVVDFTNKTTEEIQEYFIQNQGQKVCGRFKNEQINRISIPIPKSVLMQKMSFHKAFLLALFIAMGSTLFSCKNFNDEYVTGEPVVVEDVNKHDQEPLVGDTVAVPKDTIEVKVDTSFVYEQSQLDVNPTFKYKNVSFLEYFNSNFKVPVKYKSFDLAIFVTFIVERDGTLSNIKVIRNPFKELEMNLINIVKSSPKWNPGKLKNINVRSSYIFPCHIAQSVD